MERARREEACRQQLGLPKSRLRISCETDSDEVHREFYVKRTKVKKIEKGSISVKKKQARRTGPRSSSWPSTMPTDDQHTEHFRFTEKCKKLFDPNAPECCECGSRPWGTSMKFPLSRPATTRPSGDVVDENSPLCVDCSRLFRCVDDLKEKMKMINWIIAPNRAALKPDVKQLKDLCKKRVASMKRRAHDHYRKLPISFAMMKHNCRNQVKKNEADKEARRCLEVDL